MSRVGNLGLFQSLRVSLGKKQIWNNEGREDLIKREGKTVVRQK